MKRYAFLILLMLLPGCHVHFHVMGRYDHRTFDSKSSLSDNGTDDPAMMLIEGLMKGSTDDEDALKTEGLEDP